MVGVAPKFAVAATATPEPAETSGCGQCCPVFVFVATEYVVMEAVFP